MATLIYWEDTFSVTAPAGIVIPDCVTRELHTAGNQVTKHPLELGTSVSDHVIAEPDGLQLDIYQSNTPIQYLASVWNDSDRAEQAYERLLDLQQKAFLATVVTPLREYDNLILTKLSVPRDASTAGGVQMNLTFERVLIAASAIVDAPEPTMERAKPKRDLGHQSTEPASREIESKSVGLSLILAALKASGAAS